jgi:endogenous inhibitor of DNA gyrase (YacG/DUF329 family)
MIEYKNREYCKDVECDIQDLIDNGNGTELSKELSKVFAKPFCKNQCEAYKFHKWLQEHDYKIVKAKIVSEHEEMDKEFEGISEMIEFTPEDSSKQVLNELLNDIKDIADTNYGKWRDV